MVLGGWAICAPGHPLYGDGEIGRHPLVKPMPSQDKNKIYLCPICGQAFTVVQSDNK